MKKRYSFYRIIGKDGVFDLIYYYNLVKEFKHFYLLIPYEILLKCRSCTTNNIPIKLKIVTEKLEKSVLQNEYDAILPDGKAT